MSKVSVDENVKLLSSAILLSSWMDRISIIKSIADGLKGEIAALDSMGKLRLLSELSHMIEVIMGESAAKKFSSEVLVAISGFGSSDQIDADFEDDDRDKADEEDNDDWADFEFPSDWQKLDIATGGQDLWQCGANDLPRLGALFIELSHWVNMLDYGNGNRNGSAHLISLIAGAYTRVTSWAHVQKVLEQTIQVGTFLELKRQADAEKAAGVAEPNYEPFDVSRVVR